jgi:hypothetical protein
LCQKRVWRAQTALQTVALEENHINHHTAVHLRN